MATWTGAATERAGPHLVGGLRARTSQDPIRFMVGLLDFEAIKTRIEACLVFGATVRKQGVRQEARPAQGRPASR